MLRNSLDCTFWRSWFQMLVNWTLSKHWFKSEAFLTFSPPITTQHTEILLKFDQKRKDINNYDFVNYEGWAQHSNTRKCLLSTISINLSKKFLISFITSKDMSVFVYCILKNMRCCFLLVFLVWKGHNHRIELYTRLAVSYYQLGAIDITRSIAISYIKDKTRINMSDIDYIVVIMIIYCSIFKVAL